MPDTTKDRSDTAAQKGQVRLATVVIVVAFVAWMAASAIGGALGLPARFAFLLDLACMAALIWALVVLYRVWRLRQNNGV
ncbi:DUF5337 domain-containing protein [Oceanibium sediminis]|uniref:DUF5337 domain-containing protein n=1 Tax=Oceanibium sediminis TaxID=2026339 RepID=UPI0013009095|nr:DUF5337 domain-containing protein [Oceanibium sediminis]